MIIYKFMPECSFEMLYSIVYYEWLSPWERYYCFIFKTDREIGAWKFIFKNRKSPFKRTYLVHKLSSLLGHSASYFDKAVTHSLPWTSFMGTVIHGG